MTNETTYLENLLNNRKVVRNYKKTSLEDTKLKNISKFSIISKSFELFGDSNQGHFVKMVHNGIEYVEMQLISSIYYFMIESNKYKYDDIAKIFKKRFFF